MTTRKLTNRLFMRRDPAFNVMDTKKYDPAAAGVPPFYARGFDEGLAYLRQYFGATATASSKAQAQLQMTTIEWLRFQNPRKAWDRVVPLPGQFHPGLGTAGEMQALLRQQCEKRGRDGVLNVPEHWHNALVYSRMRWAHHFLNPAFEGFFQSTRLALAHDLETRGLAMVAWAVKLGLLRCCVPPEDASADEQHEHTITWIGQEQAAAVGPRVADYFASPGYEALVRKHTRPELFHIDWAAALVLPRSTNMPFDASDLAMPQHSQQQQEEGQKEEQEQQTQTAAAATTTE